MGERLGVRVGLLVVVLEFGVEGVAVGTSRGRHVDAHTRSHKLQGGVKLRGDMTRGASSESLIEENSGPWFGVDEDDTSHSGTDSNLCDANSTASFARSSSGGRGNGTMNGVGMGVTPSRTGLGVLCRPDKFIDWIWFGSSGLGPVVSPLRPGNDSIGTAMTPSRTPSWSPSPSPV